MDSLWTAHWLGGLPVSHKYQTTTQLFKTISHLASQETQATS